MKLSFREPRGSLNFGDDISLSLYIHIPWCEKKCPYCDFNSHAVRDEIPEEAYLAQLLLDLEQSLPAVWGRRVSTIFIGGGTPSLLSAAFYDALLSGVRARIPVLPDAEITLEANPGSAEMNKFLGFKQAGINRLSIGVQSFHTEHLKTLGRIHDRTAAINAVLAAQQAGFDDINLDLMFALPNQSMAQAIEDIDTAIQLGTNHLSWYQLTLEPNTAFYHRPPPGLPDESDQVDLYEAGIKRIADAGFKRYEISAYHRSKPCYHNIGYWSFGDYIGIGAGAHGKISRPDLGQLHRTIKTKHPKAYLQDCTAQVQVVLPEDIPFEYMLNACRLLAGFQLRDFESRTGLSSAVLMPALAQAATKGWIEPNFKNQVILTDTGVRFADSVVSLFLKDD